MSADAYIVMSSGRAPFGLIRGPFPEQHDAETWIKQHKAEFEVETWSVIELNFRAYWSGWSNPQTARVIGKVVSTFTG